MDTGRSSQKSPRMNDSHTSSLLEQGYIHGHASFLLTHDSARETMMLTKRENYAY
jgi:hypothetical protein